MSAIVLTTLNARYAHASFGLRYLKANLGELRDRCTILEFDISQRPVDLVAEVLARDPAIVGLGVYIWNVRESLEVIRILKQVRPAVRVVIGGPEVSHEWEAQEIVRCADHLITGEADLEFARLCRELLLGGGQPPAKTIHAPLPDLGGLRLPYEEYTEEDVANRIIYVEVSRGCPFTCEFCLSSLDVPVRQFPLAPFLEAMGRLLDRGVRHFKFVDRTFNLSLPTSTAILEFFLARWLPGLFLHFEMIPDRLPEGLRALIRRFPPGALQFEIGIQTFDPDTAQRISRRQDYGRLEANLTFLRRETGVHVHADLIAGLPGEGMETFAAGFDRLVRLAPQEIQLGILKRLRGTPIVRHDAEWQMVYSPVPPYELLRSRSLSFEQMRLFGLFARFWDLMANSGNFVESTPLLWDGDRSPFQEFRAFAEWVHARAGRRHGIALSALAGFLFEYLTAVRGLEEERVRAALLADYARTGRTDTPACLRSEPSSRTARKERRRQASGAGRQRRHGAFEREGSVPGVAGAGA